MTFCYPFSIHSLSVCSHFASQTFCYPFAIRSGFSPQICHDIGSQGENRVTRLLMMEPTSIGSIRISSSLLDPDPRRSFCRSVVIRSCLVFSSSRTGPPPVPPPPPPPAFPFFPGIFFLGDILTVLLLYCRTLFINQSV